MQRINVTKTFLPPYEEYERYVKQIWDSAWLTNQGPLLQQFEAKAKAYTGAEYFHLLSNGTVALQLALRALDITEGEIITTPFSYVATTSAILWERCTPVFVDIEPDTFCIDPAKIEAAITPQTKAIMPVHVFGNPCDIEAIDRIARKHNLKVIYDGAHAFGARYDGASLLTYGDITTCSFHATKLFHTIEGGAIITKDQALHDRVDLLKRFGHNGDDHLMLGINAKASEFQAAMGLANLPYLDAAIAARKQVHEQYTAALASRYRTPVVPAGKIVYNYSYYPLLFDSEAELLAALDTLAAEQIFSRRYFYPALNRLPYITDAAECPVAEDIAKRIICLPLYAGLEPAVVTKICEVIQR